MGYTSPQQRLSYLFQRYLQKTCTAEEKDELMHFIGQAQYDNQVKELLQESWDAALPPYEQDAEKANAIFNAILRQDKPTQAEQQKRPLFFIRYMAAAMVLIALGIGLYYFTRPVKLPVAKTVPVPPPPAEHQYLTLPDGSKVLLNAGSRLDYPAAFGKTREVHLTGEAYFDIRHDASKPFVVYAGNTKTIVLGTAFNIKAFPNQINVVVTVTRGKVRVEKDTQTLGVLTKNEQIVVNEKTYAVTREVVNTSEAMAWKQDDILLDDVSLQEAAGMLQQRFNTSIRFSRPALANCRITASFLHHENLEQILKVITLINHMEYQFQQDNSIVISGEGCNE